MDYKLCRDDYLDLVSAQGAAEILHTTRQSVYKMINSQKIKGFKSDTGKYLVVKSSIANYTKQMYDAYWYYNTSPSESTSNSAIKEEID